MAGKESQQNSKNKEESIFIKFAQSITAFGTVILAISAIFAIFWYLSQSEQRSQERFRILLNEFADNDRWICKSAAENLAKDYPKEASKIFVHRLAKEEDRVFSKDLTNYIEQIGKDAILPLVDELKQLQKKIDLLQIEFLLSEEKSLFKSIKTIIIKRQKVCKYFSKEVMDEAKLHHEALASRLRINSGSGLNLHIFATPTTLENIKIKLNVQQQTEITEEEIVPFFEKLNNIWSSNQKLISTHKDFKDLLMSLLRKHHVKNLPLSFIDLSGVDLSIVDLSDANLEGSVLSSARMEDTNLNGANLTRAMLRDATLAGVCLTGTDLAYADLTDVTFTSAPIGKRWVKLKNLPAEVEFPNNLKNKIRYWPMEKVLIFEGPMSKSDRDELLKLSRDINYRKAISELFNLCFERRTVGFRRVKDFTKTILTGVKGLSKEDIEYAKSIGAEVD